MRNVNPTFVKRRNWDEGSLNWVANSLIDDGEGVFAGDGAVEV
jgi:hypothetical protein